MKQRDELAGVTVKEALNHPIGQWELKLQLILHFINKGLEVMEAKWLFDVDYDQIEIFSSPEKHHSFDG